MLKRLSAGHRPQLTFTSDFHELVQGDLLPGPCVLRYDPFRIAPHEHIAGKTALPGKLTVEVVFHPQGTHWSTPFDVQSGRALDIVPDVVGQGTMCKANFNIPEGCEELECWFQYIDACGNRYWDSNQGRNYWLRFPTHDLLMISASVDSSSNKAADTLQMEVTSVSQVGSMEVRWRAMKFGPGTRQISPLSAASSNEPGRTLWSPSDPIEVPQRSPVAFDIVYTVEGRSYTDDNEGNWYVVD